MDVDETQIEVFGDLRDDRNLRGCVRLVDPPVSVFGDVGWEAEEDAGFAR